MVLTAGLEEGELQKLAQLGERALKTARRDIAHVVRFWLLAQWFVSTIFCIHTFSVVWSYKFRFWSWFQIARKATGATTVSATMFLAAKVKPLPHNFFPDNSVNCFGCLLFSSSLCVVDMDLHLKFFKVKFHKVISSGLILVFYDYACRWASVFLWLVALGAFIERVKQVRFPGTSCSLFFLISCKPKQGAMLFPLLLMFHL